MKRSFKYTLLGTAWFLNMMLLSLSTVDADVGYIAFSSYRGENRDIYIIDINGQNLRNLTNSPDTGEFNPTFSPDGRFIAYHAYHKRNADIYVLDLKTQTRKRLTDHLSNDRAPAWAPDGKWIAFISNRHASYDIYKMNPNGGNLQRVTRMRNRNEYAPSWSPDSQSIAFYSSDGKSAHIYVVSAAGQGERQLARAVRPSPTWSPTGDQIAFPSSNGAWDFHIFIMSEKGLNVHQLTHGALWDEDPAWSSDGRWIVYASSPPIKGNRQTDIYLVNVLNGESRQLTTHPEGDYDPTWMPKSFFSVSPSLEKMTTLWGQLKKAEDTGSGEGDR